MRKLGGLLIAGATLALSGCIGMPPSASKPTPTPTPTPQTIALTGQITVRPAATMSGPKSGPCVITNGYADIREGAQVTITDETGAIVALGNLGAGKITEAQDVPGGRMFVSECVFPLGWIDVPERPFYGVEVAKRGVVRYTREQIRSEVNLTLG